MERAVAPPAARRTDTVRTRRGRPPDSASPSSMGQLGLRAFHVDRGPLAGLVACGIDNRERILINHFASHISSRRRRLPPIHDSSVRRRGATRRGRAAGQPGCGKLRRPGCLHRLCRPQRAGDAAVPRAISHTATRRPRVWPPLVPELARRLAAPLRSARRRHSSLCRRTRGHLRNQQGRALRTLAPRVLSSPTLRHARMHQWAPRVRRRRHAARRHTACRAAPRPRRQDRRRRLRRRRRRRRVHRSRYLSC